MHPIGQRTEKVSDISVGLVQAALLKLLYHHATLHIEALLAEGQFQHAVGIQPEADLYIRFRDSQVVVGDVIVCPGIVLAARRLQRGVIVGYIRRTAEHQMLEQMGKPGMFGMFVTGSHIVDDVQGNHLRTAVFAVHQPQSVREAMFIYLHKRKRYSLKDMPV